MSAKRKADILERVTDEEKDSTYYENAIKSAVQEYYFENYQAETPEEIGKLSQNTFLGACLHARKVCIERDALLDYIPHRTGGGSIVCNESYNEDKIEMLCNAYIEICYLYDKIPSIYGFSELTGVDRGILHDWINKCKGVSCTSRDHRGKRAIQKLRDARGEMLQNAAISGGKPAIGSIAVLNNTIWGKVEETREEMPVLSAEDLPDLRRLSEREEKPRQQLPRFNSNSGEMEMLPDLSAWAAEEEKRNKH